MGNLFLWVYHDKINMSDQHDLQDVFRPIDDPKSYTLGLPQTQLTHLPNLTGEITGFGPELLEPCDRRRHSGGFWRQHNNRNTAKKKSAWLSVTELSAISKPPLKNEELCRLYPHTRHVQVEAAWTSPLIWDDHHPESLGSWDLLTKYREIKVFVIFFPPTYYSYFRYFLFKLIIIRTNDLNDWQQIWQQKKKAGIQLPAKIDAWLEPSCVCRVGTEGRQCSFVSSNCKLRKYFWKYDRNTKE